jgi:NADH:ubiquinone oxidoreductase subunit 5 (subunit L)/multisubunit Na+/H+ antiporter MnhA subunit
MLFYNSIKFDYDIALVVENGIVDPQLCYNFGNVIDFQGVQAGWSFKFDNLALVMLTVIFAISFFVHMYSL